MRNHRYLCIALSAVAFGFSTATVRAEPMDLGATFPQTDCRFASESASESRFARGIRIGGVSTERDAQEVCAYRLRSYLFAKYGEASGVIRGSERGHIEFGANEKTERCVYQVNTGRQIPASTALRILRYMNVNPSAYGNSEGVLEHERRQWSRELIELVEIKCVNLVS